MKKYDEYKDSGIEWIGEIPKHWRIGKVKNGFNRNKDKAFQENPTILSLTSKGVIIRDISNKDGQIAESYYEYNRVIPGDLLLNPMDLVTNAFAFVSNYDGVISPAYFNLKSNSFFNNKYYEYYFQLQYWNSSFFHHGKGVSTEHRWTLNEETFKNFPLPIPPLSEQTSIASYLDRKTAEIDELIANKKRLLELYEEEKTAIINQAVTKGINPDAPMKDSGIEWLGEIPEHWKVIPMKYLGRFINGFSFKSTDFVSTGVRVLKISNIQHMKIDWSDESFIDETFYESHENFRVLYNDLVFALTRPIISTGIKVALVDTMESILLNQRNSIYRPTEIDVKWIYYILLSSSFIQEFDSRIDKTGQQPNISSNDIGEIDIPIPIENEQQFIVRHIETECGKINMKIDKTEKLIALLTEYRTALISEVVTGKIKVID